MGLIASTAFFTMNTTINYIASPCYDLSRVKTKEDSLDARQSAETCHIILQQRRETQQRGFLVGPPLAIFQGLVYFYAAQAAGFRTTPGRYSLTAAVCAAAIVPFSLVFISDVSKQLRGMANASVETLQDDEALIGETYQLLDKWAMLSKIRAVMPLFSIVAAFFALVV